MQRRYWLGLVLLLRIAMPAHGQTTLAWKWKEGDKFYLDLNTRVKQSMTFAGNPITMETNRNQLDSFTVTKVSGDTVVLTETIESSTMKMEGGLPGGEEFGKAFQKMEGASFTVTLNPKEGKIVKVEGADEAMKKAFGDNEMTRQLLGSMFGESAVRNTLEDVFVAYLPGKPVNPGDKWNRKSNILLPMLGSLDVDAEYTYRGKAELDGKKLDKIEVVSTLKYLPPKKGAGGLPGVTKGDMKFDKAKGTFYFDAEAGRLVQMENQLNGKGTLSMSFMGQDLDIDMEFGQTAKGRVTDKKPEQRKLEIKIDKPTGKQADK